MAERAVYRDGESECKIIDYGFGWKSLWYDEDFYSDVNEWRQQVGYSLSAWVVKFYSSSGAAAALAAYSPRAAWTVAWGCWSNKTSSSWSSQFSCRHLVASYCQNNHLQQARTNLTMINYVWYQTFTIKFFISTLNVSFLSLPSPQWTWRIKSIRKRKCGFEVQML